MYLPCDKVLGTLFAHKNKGITYRRDLSRQVNGLDNIAVAWLERAFEIDIGNLLAEVGLGREQLNEAVLDADLDFSSLFDSLLDRAARCDEKLLAAVLDCVSSGFVLLGSRLNRPRCHTYALGGLGERSTLLIWIKSDDRSPSQSSRGDSPGILWSSSVTVVLKTPAETAGASSAAMNASENFIVVNSQAWNIIRSTNVNIYSELGFGITVGNNLDGDGRCRRSR